MKEINTPKLLHTEESSRKQSLRGATEVPLPIRLIYQEHSTEDLHPDDPDPDDLGVNWVGSKHTSG
jgi:hypothetical protein